MHSIDKYAKGEVRRRRSCVCVGLFRLFSVISFEVTKTPKSLRLTKSFLHPSHIIKVVIFNLPVCFSSPEHAYGELLGYCDVHRKCGRP